MVKPEQQVQLEAEGIQFAPTGAAEFVFDFEASARVDLWSDILNTLQDLVFRWRYNGEPHVCDNPSATFAVSLHVESCLSAEELYRFLEIALGEMALASFMQLGHLVPFTGGFIRIDRVV